MSDLNWQEPPASRQGAPGARAWVAEAEALREHPKRWALLQTCKGEMAAANFASQSRRGEKVAFRPVGEWEFRTNGPEVYVRFVGSGSAGGAT